MAEAEILTPRQRSLANLRHIKPGQVLNPLGPKASKNHGLALYIRECSKEGKELIDFLFDVIHGEVNQFNSIKNKLVAVKELLDRGWGQAPQTIMVGANGETKPLFDLTKLTNAEFELFKSLASKIAPVVDSEQESQSVQKVDNPIASQDQPQPTIPPQQVV